MKLLNSFGPNPRLVRMFMAEKGITLPSEDLDLLGGANRQAPYLSKNPAGQTPALELDDGTVIAETVTICEYLEEKHPTPALVGTTAEQRAETRMWVRRVELNITEYMYNGFRFAEGIEIFRNRMLCLPEAAAGLKAKGKAGREWLNGLMAGRDFIVGSRFSLADIVFFACVDFAKGVGQPLEPEFANLTAWYARVAARPSAQSSLHPAAPQLKMAG
ncbi:MAG: glutathione S-transferase family protein [Gammaproteobacteria bacterium]|nr:glutathione S-transferase family protein [Gammaproteobacteria bacterium]